MYLNLGALEVHESMQPKIGKHHPQACYCQFVLKTGERSDSCDSSVMLMHLMELKILARMIYHGCRNINVN
jgi:hypothetical protein